MGAQGMSYLLIIILTVSGASDARLRVSPDLESCLLSAKSVKAWVATVPGEWRLKTMCVPIPSTTEV